MSDIENKHKERLSGNFLLLILLLILGLAMVLTISILPNILPHADEYQFYANAWNIMSGKQLQNFLHIALTEYALTGFLLLVNLLVPSGVNFPQGDPSLVTYFYGRVFGLLLYLITFIVGVLILQKEEKSVKLRTVIFAVLYFGSVGVFERFLRVNSDSMSVFVALNYILLSLWFHRRRMPPSRFLILDTLFIFASSFTNLKALYMVLPLLLLNTAAAFFVYDGDYAGPKPRLPKLYRLIFHTLFLVGACILLWVYLIPRPINDPKYFWYNIKNGTVRGTNFDFEYPSQAYNSWAVYIYDFFVEYLGLSQLIPILVIFGLAFYLGRRTFLKYLFSWARGSISISAIKSGNLYPLAEFIIFLCFLSYYIGVGKAMIHWSRWGVPLGVLGMLMLSSVLERTLSFIWSFKFNKSLFVLTLPFLFLFAWSLRIALFVDIARSDYPKQSGFSLTYTDVDNFLKEKGISKEDAQKKVAWFTGYTSNVGNISLEKVVDPAYKDLEYILWPYWNIGLLHTPNYVDRLTTNQREFINKYAQDVSYRFPSLMSYYMHYTKYFAWHYLGITWNPELDAVVENQYGVVHLKKLPPTIFLNYEVPFKEMSHAYSPYSLIYNLATLPDTYIFPTCYSHPDVVEVSTGKKVEPPPGLNGGRTAGRYCHSLWFRVFLKGNYKIKIEGLPENKDNSQVVYSTLPFTWDPATKTLDHTEGDTRISAEIGVATKEKNIPNLKFIVSYELTAK